MYRDISSQLTGEDWLPHYNGTCQGVGYIRKHVRKQPLIYVLQAEKISNGK